MLLHELASDWHCKRHILRVEKVLNEIKYISQYNPSKWPLGNIVCAI